jgi:hypothetical protein
MAVIPIRIITTNPVTSINCGSPGPGSLQLGGAIDITQFPDLSSFVCPNHGIVSFKGFNSCPKITNFILTNNNISGFFNSVFPNFSNRTNMVTFVIQNRNFSRFPLLSGTIPDLSSLTNLTNFTVQSNNLTGPIPNLNNNRSLQTFAAAQNRLTGDIPSLSALTRIDVFLCDNNSLSGSIPSLSSNKLLRNFNAAVQRGIGLTGNIPSLSGNPRLESFTVARNSLTGFDGGTFNIRLTAFYASSNQLTQTAIDDILLATVNAGANGGILLLDGTGNASPSFLGLFYKSILLDPSRGPWIVRTN